MPDLNPPPFRATHRRPFTGGGAFAAGGLQAILVLFTGCATRGPNHVYATTAAGAGVHDITAGKTIPRVLSPLERTLGLAYDFNTDHLFVRIAPAQIIRVIERPSGRILRHMPLQPELHTNESADLAIRSSDRHLFAVHADRRSVIELTLYGEPIRRIEFASVTTKIDGLAYDQRQDHLLVLSGNTVRAFGHAGNEVSRVELVGPVHAVSLGYDSNARHFFVPLSDGTSIGEFDSDGRLVKTHPSGQPLPLSALDAGERSLVRVF